MRWAPIPLLVFVFLILDMSKNHGQYTRSISASLDHVWRQCPQAVRAAQLQHASKSASTIKQCYRLPNLGVAGSNPAGVANDLSRWCRAAYAFFQNSLDATEDLQLLHIGLVVATDAVNLHSRLVRPRKRHHLRDVRAEAIPIEEVPRWRWSRGGYIYDDAVAVLKRLVSNVGRSPASRNLRSVQKQAGWRTAATQLAFPTALSEPASPSLAHRVARLDEGE